MTERLTVTVSAKQLDAMRAAISAIGSNVDGAIARAINHTGDKAKTAVTRALVAQTGLPRKTIVAFLRVQRAGSAKGTALYALRGRGGNISLKYFGAKETPTGVSAAPLGQRTVYAGTFMKAGRFPNRVAKPNWNGQVFRRAGGTSSTGKPKFEKVVSGVYLPEQMISGASAEAFREAVVSSLPARLDHELKRAMAGQS